MVHWWLVGGCCRLLVGSWWSICRSSRGPSFRAGQRQGNGRATRQGGNAGVGAGPGHKPSTKLDITSDGWINSRLNLLTRFFHPRSALHFHTTHPSFCLPPNPFSPLPLRYRIGCERARKILAWKNEVEQRESRENGHPSYSYTRTAARCLFYIR